MLIHILTHTQYHAYTDIVHMTRVRENMSQTIVNNWLATTQKTKDSPYKKRHFLLALVKVLTEIKLDISLLYIYLKRFSTPAFNLGTSSFAVFHSVSLLIPKYSCASLFLMPFIFAHGISGALSHTS